MQEISTKPYLLRALYEWCTDNGFTPHIAVRVDNGTRVPRQFVRIRYFGFLAHRRPSMEARQVW